jgi:hypothetical protein
MLRRKKGKRKILRKKRLNSRKGKEENAEEEEGKRKMLRKKRKKSRKWRMRGSGCQGGET